MIEGKTMRAIDSLYAVFFTDPVKMPSGSTICVSSQNMLNAVFFCPSNFFFHRWGDAIRVVMKLRR